MAPDFLFVVRVDVANRQAAIEVMSEILTFAAFDIPVRVLFLDAAVKWVSPDADPEIKGMIASLAFYGVTTLLIERESLEAFSLDSVALPEGSKSLNRCDIQDILCRHKGLIGA